MNRNETAAPHESGQTLHGWTRALAEILEQLRGSEPVIRRSTTGKREAQVAFWWKCADGPLIYFGISASDAALLPRLMDGEGASGAAGDVQQNFKLLMDRSWGRAGVVVTDPPASGESIEACSIQFASGQTLRIFAARVPKAAQGASNLEMLLDIELPVTLRFGSRRMVMRDVASLTTGSVVELDRGIDDPIEVLINGHVIARGEAVTVGGAYGVRISAVSSRREQWIASSFEAAESGMGSKEEQIG